MHELLVKYYEGEITPSEKEELFRLIEKDEALKSEYIALQSLKALSSSLSRQDDQQQARFHLARFKRKKNIRTAKRILFTTFQYAAVMLLAVAATWYATKYIAPGEDPLTHVFEEFHTPAGQRAMVKLYDGTTVWLNARSTLRYPVHFSGHERRVELDGEAFFDVQHNGELPFIVSTENLDIKVLGTSFNVFAYRGYDEFKTALTVGSISIYNKGNEANGITLEPFEVVELVDNKLVKSRFSNDDFLMWREGIYAFDDQPFSEIIKKLELYYDVVIHVENRKLYEYRFSGKFRQRDGVESVLRTLRKVYHFSFMKDDQDNIITIY